MADEPQIGDIVYIEWLDAGWFSIENGKEPTTEELSQVGYIGQTIGRLVALTNRYYVLRPDYILCTNTRIDDTVNARYDYVPRAWVLTKQWWTVSVSQDGTEQHPNQEVT